MTGKKKRRQMTSSDGNAKNTIRAYSPPRDLDLYFPDNITDTVPESEQTYFETLSNLTQATQRKTLKRTQVRDSRFEPVKATGPPGPRHEHVSPRFEQVVSTLVENVGIEFG
jgi:hypothetical protein